METFTSTIAGSNFRPAEAKAALDNCVVGDTLQLVRDPSNEYDMNAIKLVLEDDGQEHFVGFVARKDNQRIAELMDAGAEFEAAITELDESGKRNHIITISEVAVDDEVEDEFESEDEDETTSSDD